MTNMMDDEAMTALLQALNDPSVEDSKILSGAIADFPMDARLHFLLGSTLAGEGRNIEAHAALSKSVDLSPDFHIARFQFGLFQLTSGESDNALKTWARLDALPEAHYLRIFVIGLRHLIRDELSECLDCLQRGLELNTENEPLNGDMKKIMAEISPLVTSAKQPGKTDSAGSEATGSDEKDEVSLTSLLLRQTDNRTRH